MSDFLALALALLAGGLLGVFFFGGLWWTVQKGVTSEGPRSGSSAACCCEPGSFWLDSILFRRAIGRGSWRASLDS